MFFVIILSVSICLLTTSCTPEEYEAFWDGYNYGLTGDESVFDD